MGSCLQKEKKPKGPPDVNVVNNVQLSTVSPNDVAIDASRPLPAVPQGKLTKIYSNKSHAYTS